MYTSKNLKRNTVKFKKLDPLARVPKYAKPGDSCADLYARLDEKVTIPAGRCRIVPTGLALVLPPGYEGQIRSRSGLSAKGICVANGIGTIDNAFVGHCGVILQNNSIVPFEVSDGDRIAQLAVVPIEQFDFEEIDELPVTERNTNGFGSTGVR